MTYYDRYYRFRGEGQVYTLPFIPILYGPSDIYITYDKRSMRFDTLSYKYYGDPNYAWLILQANPEYGGYEFSIPDGVTLRIPYPIESALDRYSVSVDSYLAMNE